MILEDTHGEANCDGCGNKIPDGAERMIIVDRNLVTMWCKDCDPEK